MGFTHGDRVKVPGFKDGADYSVLDGPWLEEPTREAMWVIKSPEGLLYLQYESDLTATTTTKEDRA